MTTTLSLKVVSQERLVVEAEVRSVSAPTVQGEVTILPGHIPLFAQLQAGELRYTQDGEEHYTVISPGFLNVTPSNEITIMIDSAVNDRDITLEKAQAAIEQAKSTIATAADRRELIMAEASLKRAMLELQVAQKTRRTKI
jgi:F-type H+-transporting ATPase subunit epsilon